MGNRNEKVIEFPKKSTAKNPAAVALGRLGGKKGGNARAAILTIEQRKSIAKKAAQSRWKTQRSTLE